MLDLDETLVHCSTSYLDNSDIKFAVEFNGLDYNICARFRPHYAEFLSKLSKKFELVLFTASQKPYADKLANFIDPTKQIKHRLFRDSCLFISGNYIKDLAALGRDMKQVIIVDNSPQAFGYQLANGIPILSWYDDNNDRELLKTMDFLDKIQHVDDVR